MEGSVVTGAAASAPDPIVPPDPRAALDAEWAGGAAPSGWVLAVTVGAS